MSVTVDYFFNYSADLFKLAGSINRCLGCELSPYENDPENLFTHFLGMEFSLEAATDYVNDRECNFENFAFHLDFRTTWGGSDSHPVQLPAMALVAYNLHRWLGITGILVFDMQVLLARYEEKEVPNFGLRLFDVLSGTPFVSFVAHLSQLQKRLPERWQDFYFDAPEP